MHGRAPTAHTLPQLQAESNENMSITALISHDGTSAEMYHKVLRVKSLKMYQWLIDEGAVYYLFCCTLTINSLERVMFTFMQWQQNDCWMSPGKSPVIQMANLDNSPAARAIRELAAVMSHSSFGTEAVTVDEFVAGIGCGALGSFFWISSRKEMILWLM